jgi:hypothetical protein
VVDEVCRYCSWTTWKHYRKRTSTIVNAQHYLTAAADQESVLFCLVVGRCRLAPSLAIT